MTRRRLTIVVAATVLALAGCSSTDPTPTDSPTGSAVSSGQDVYEQTLSWAPCGDLECATVRVPLDWTKPRGDTIGIAINRSPAADPANSLGSLLINPGGPGASGLDLTENFVASAGADLLDRYDVIGFDPRGVGASAPVTCGDAATLDEFVTTDFPLDTQDDVDAAHARNKEYAALCEKESGAIATNVDTVSAARDMDVIRAVLGDEKLNYLGYSYGTQLGATYAALYPTNVGRMTLDGVVDFLLPTEEIAAGQAAGFEGALTAYVEDCLKVPATCPLTGTVKQAKNQIRTIAQGAIANPWPSDDGIEVNGNLTLYGIIVTLYDEKSWEYLSIALEEILTKSTATVMGRLADFYLDRDSTTGQYSSNSTAVFPVIGCLDEIKDVPWDLARVQSFQTLMDAASPTFGWWFGLSVGCDSWPTDAHEHVTSLDPTIDAGPILVIGTTNDPATPYQWAKSLAGKLGDATLLTYDGEGHTAYGRSNACIIDAVDGYMVDGVMPDSGKTC